MKISLFIIFVLLCILLATKKPEDAAKLKYLKLYGIAIPVALVVAVLVMLAIKALGIRPGEGTRELFFQILMSVLAILLMNVMTLVADYLIDLLLKFQIDNNAQNIDRFPVRFWAKHKTTIKSAVRILFFLGTVLMLYGLWLGKKTDTK